MMRTGGKADENFAILEKGGLVSIRTYSAYSPLQKNSVPFAVTAISFCRARTEARMNAHALLRAASEQCRLLLINY